MNINIRLVLWTLCMATAGLSCNNHPFNHRHYRPWFMYRGRRRGGPRNHVHPQSPSQAYLGGGLFRLRSRMRPGALDAEPERRPNWVSEALASLRLCRNSMESL